MAAKPTYYEFFAGGGMARAGLGDDWRCLFANDYDHSKAIMYKANWCEENFHFGDIHDLKPGDIPERADLAWASFPCQDLSLAGNGAGLDGNRSGAFWGFKNLIKELRTLGRSPRLVVLENVVGTLTSNKGQDFVRLCRALKSLGYRFGALVIDAVHFVPQSRPRLFIIALQTGLEIPEALTSASPDPTWVPTALMRARDTLPVELRRLWQWWRLSPPSTSNIQLIDLIDDFPRDVRWHEKEETSRLIAMMSERHRAKLNSARKMKGRVVGTVYRRMRRDVSGSMIQRAEARFDGIAGCLRTPKGGSSRQFIIIVEGESIRTRLLSAREAARLMGLPEDYKLPKRYNEAYHLISDGLAIPAIRHLSHELLLPLVRLTSHDLDSRHHAIGEVI